MIQIIIGNVLKNSYKNNNLDYHVYLVVKDKKDKYFIFDLKW